MEITEELIKIIKQTPNDQELGYELRKLYYELDFIKSHPNDMELGNKVRSFFFALEKK